MKTIFKYFKKTFFPLLFLFLILFASSCTTWNSINVGVEKLYAGDTLDLNHKDKIGAKVWLVQPNELFIDAKIKVDSAKLKKLGLFYKIIKN